MQELVIVGLLLVATEMLPLIFFTTAYYRTGIAVYKERLPANTDARARLALHTLEGTIFDNDRRPLVFLNLSKDCVAFRRSYVPTFHKRPLLMMRGRVDVDHRRGEVRVVGMCSWTSLLLPITLVITLGLKGAMFALVLGVPIAAMSYLLQRTAFRQVVKAVRWQLVDHEAIDLTQRQDARQRPGSVVDPFRDSPRPGSTPPDHYA